jgi:hypothetical protein
MRKLICSAAAVGLLVVLGTQVATGASQVTVTVTKVGSGTVFSARKGLNCPVDQTTCEKSFKAGSPLVLQARAADGFEFTGWTGDCAGESRKRCKLPRMFADKFATATFVPVG